MSAVSTFLFQGGANITESAQHSTDPVGGMFFMRTEFYLDGLDVERQDIEQSFQREVAERFDMDWRISYRSRRPRVAIMVSKAEHCLLDLLWRWRRDELDAEIVHVVSNHAELAPEVASFDLPFTHVPVEKEQKSKAESEILSLLSGHVDLVVLARYMQILSGDFLRRINAPVINIHHSFLPAFVGPTPYRQALVRGVKIIGATAHYVTEDLDEGPIIEQDVERVSYRHDAADLTRIGRDIERTVLSRAVQWHLEDRVIVHANKTFVFA